MKTRKYFSKFVMFNNLEQDPDDDESLLVRRSQLAVVLIPREYADGP